MLVYPNIKPKILNQMHTLYNKLVLFSHSQTLQIQPKNPVQGVSGSLEEPQGVIKGSIGNLSQPI